MPYHRSEEHTSELQSLTNLVCRLLLEKNKKDIIKRAAEHKGTSFVEIYQNCNVFNDGAFFRFTEKDTKDDNVVFIEHGKPLVFGKEHNKGIRLNGFTPEVVSLADGKYSVND